jgi:hypothetical protein
LKSPFRFSHNFSFHRSLNKEYAEAEKKEKEKRMKLLLASALALFWASITAAAYGSGHPGSLRANGKNKDNYKRRMAPASEIFPPYTQQCRDDAGPPFGDDEETFGDKKYHEGKPAFAVGDCPQPLEGACSQKSKTAAFLEGPIDCGGKGWFCRIHEEEGWPNIMLNTDVNFGYCNTTEGYEDKGWDGSGHCHGSDSDDTFYWWVRDHWFRQYVSRESSQIAIRFVLVLVVVLVVVFVFVVVLVQSLPCFGLLWIGALPFVSLRFVSRYVYSPNQHIILVTSLSKYKQTNRNNRTDGSAVAADGRTQSRRGASSIGATTVDW